MNQELRDALTLKYQGDVAAAKANNISILIVL